MKKVAVFLFCILLFSGCDQKPPTTTTEEDTNEIKIVENNSSDYSVIVPQETSPIRGVVADNVDVSLDLNAMESGLQEIVKSFADPKNYYYQSGSVLSEEEAYSLLQREMTQAQYDNKLKEEEEALNIGLNPILNDGDDPASQKMYTTTIIEQDYYIYEGANLKLDTIAFAVGIDPLYNYTEGDVDKEVEITDDELHSYAYTDIASKLINYVLAKEGMQDKNILVAFYKHSTTTNTLGNFDGYVYKSKDSDKNDSLVLLDNQNVFFPSDTGAEVDSTINDKIQSLDADLRKYFSAYTGVTATGTYVDGTIQELDIEIIANFYSQVDVNSFVSYLEEWLNKNVLARQYPIVIEVNSADNNPLALIQVDEDIEKYIY